MRSLLLYLALIQSGGTPPGLVGVATANETVTLRMRLTDRDARTPVPYVTPRGTIVFTATINGRPVNVVLDSGAERTLIDTGFARQAGIGMQPSGRHAITSAGTLVGTAQTDGVTLAIPGALRVEGPVMALDLRPLAAALGRPVDAVLGSDVLAEIAVLIDPDNRRLSFHAGGSARPTGATVALPIAEGSIVAAELNGQKVALRIDLGAAGAFRLSDAAWRRVVPAGAPIRAGEQTSADGVTRVTRVGDAALRIGPVRIDRVPVDSGYMPAGAADGLLGNGFLSRGPVILDLKGRQLLLLPRQPSSNATRPRR